MYLIRWVYDGRVNYAKTDDYGTAVVIQEALTKAGRIDVEVWQGNNLMRRG